MLFEVAKMNLTLIKVCYAVVFSSTVLAGYNTLVLQQNLNGYSGCEDTMLSHDSASANFGGSGTLTIGGVPWGGFQKLDLIRFKTFHDPGWG